MKNTQIVIMFMVFLSVFPVSAYDDRAMLWHDDGVPYNSFVSFDGRWYTDRLDDDPQAHIKAQREKEYNEKKAQIKYHSTQRKIRKGN